MSQPATTLLELMQMPPTAVYNLQSTGTNVEVYLSIVVIGDGDELDRPARLYRNNREHWFVKSGANLGGLTNATTLEFKTVAAGKADVDTWLDATNGTNTTNEQDIDFQFRSRAVTIKSDWVKLPKSSPHPHGGFSSFSIFRFGSDSVWLALGFDANLQSLTEAVWISKEQTAGGVFPSSPSVNNNPVVVDAKPVTDLPSKYFIFDDHTCG